MTAPAIAAPPQCPKCGGDMWDQKHGKFPWKPGTPIFKCKDKECATNGGVIWEPKGAAAPKPSPAKAPIPAHSNVPDKDLPPFLQNATAQDNAELAAKVGVDLTGIANTLALYQGIAEWASRELPPIFARGKDAVGMTPESLAACANTIFINTAGKR